MKENKKTEPSDLIPVSVIDAEIKKLETLLRQYPEAKEQQWEIHTDVLPLLRKIKKEAISIPKQSMNERCQQQVIIDLQDEKQNVVDRYQELNQKIRDRIAELEKYDDDYCIDCGQDTNKEVLDELRKLVE